MLPLDSLVVLSSSGLIALAMVAGVAAWSWKGWLQLQLHRDHRSDPHADLPAIGARIDLADMKERIRKLEAIAAGVEL
ncbi:hypothetical protein KX816_20565 [Sphingosinicellaceae bacterium]|nr:hypothetical protein KX816_20565 [Sphingosinicellaceae bacterium]